MLLSFAKKKSKSSYNIKLESWGKNDDLKTGIALCNWKEKGVVNKSRERNLAQC